MKVNKRPLLVRLRALANGEAELARDHEAFVTTPAASAKRSAGCESFLLPGGISHAEWMVEHHADFARGTRKFVVAFSALGLFALALGCGYVAANTRLALTAPAPLGLAILSVLSAGLIAVAAGAARQAAICHRRAGLIRKARDTWDASLDQLRLRVTAPELYDPRAAALHGKQGRLVH